jgi:hypothetical protein
MATMKKGKAMAKPKLKKAQSGGYNDTSGKKKIGPALGIGIPVTGMVAAGANMIKNAVKRRKAAKAEEEKKKATEAAKKMTMKKAGGVAKYKMGGMKKYQPGGGTGRLEGPLPEFAARQVSDYSKKNPIPDVGFVAPNDDRGVFGNKIANKYRDPKYSFHHQATNEFYNDNKDLYNKDIDAYYKKMDATRPAVMKEIEKRKAVANDRITMTPRPAVPIQKRGGAAKATYKTGGMVNPNAKVSALKKAGSNGVKSGVNPKATAAKKATGKTGGISKAPRTAKPKKNK